MTVSVDAAVIVVMVAVLCGSLLWFWLAFMTYSRAGDEDLSIPPWLR